MNLVQTLVRKFRRWLRDEDRKDARRVAARAARNIPPPEKKRLTFELTPNPEALEIYCDKEGLLNLLHYTKRLSSRDFSLPDHDHWMAESIGGHDLPAAKQGAANTPH